MTSLGLAVAAGLVYLGAGTALTIGTFLTPQSFAEDATSMRTHDALVIKPFGHLPAIAHQVMVAGHSVLVFSLHYAFLVVHACIDMVSALFGL